MSHVMLDLETYGTGHHAAIAAVGSCVFDPDRPDEPIEKTFYRQIDLSKSKLPGVCDPATVEWWLMQSREARVALLRGTRVPLEQALVEWQTWLFEATEGSVRIWSNGPTFDDNILRDAFQRHGWDFPAPFWTARCFRTLKELVGPRAADLAPKREGTHHCALDDAIYQARCAQRFYQALRSPATP